ncbi:hypothetical protein [Yersinia frederiksenii]|nr:hypothetical protein [Yersinia frederiksenii]
MSTELITKPNQAKQPDPPAKQASDTCEARVSKGATLMAHLAVEASEPR